VRDHALYILCAITHNKELCAITHRKATMRVHTVRELGGLVRDHRERLALTQQEVADRAAVTRDWLVRFENGKATVPVSRVFDVLAALELVVDVSESRA
jgi:HTH-type transcriptional regulator/antitoxin HipB